MVVVVTIIAFMATIIMVSYSSLARSYKLGLLVDGLTSQASALKTQTTAQNQLKCYGFQIESGGLVSLAVADFTDPLRKCAAINVETEAYPDPLLTIDKIRVGSATVPQLNFYYTPPLGALFFPGREVGNSSLISFDVHLSTDPDGEKSKTLYLIPATGQITDINPQADE